MKSKLVLALIIALTTLSLPARAQLQPAQIAILVNKKSKQSGQLGTYYAQMRGIPSSQIMSIDIPMGETLSRDDWDKVKVEIRNWVSAKQLQNKLKCIVTTWDVPLKIGQATTLDFETKRRQTLLLAERSRRVDRLLTISTDFDQISPDGTAAATSLGSDAGLKEVTESLSGKLRAAEARINAMAAGDEDQKAAKQAAIKKLTELSVATAGLQVVVQNMKRTLDSGTADQQAVARLQTEYYFGNGRLAGLNEGQSLLDGLPATIERDTNLIASIERSTGIAGSINWIDNQLEMLTKNETHSSFDSELSMVLEGNYPLLRWLPNYLHYNYDGSPLRTITRTMMVSRIDAPTLPLAKAIIDKSIAVEKTGLTGKVYLDARGLCINGLDHQVAPGSIQDYDRSLLFAEKFFRDNTQLEIVVDNNNDVFKEGTCPDAALYCGWYSLAKYVPAFTWKPGSIGYHMASSEASTIRKPDSQVWCKKMLDNGIAGTYGPVFEPYLLAFPRPNEFFALLCSGKYTYVECMYRTKVTNSWTMTTIGDPLYNPFKAKPAFTGVPKDIVSPSNQARVLVSYKRLFGVK